MFITIALIALTCAISFPCFQNRGLLDRLLFWPPAVNRGEYWRLVTHGFVHADGQHLLFNMVTLFFFGRAIEGFFERYIGVAGFALFYLAAIVVAILPSYLRHKNDSRYRSLGASGAVSAVLFAYILIAPWSTIYVFFFPIPAILYAILFTAYGFYATRLGHDHINHSAHLWGAGFGLLFTLCMEPRIGPIFLERLMQPGFGG
ncbi:rhomboid family intramembrane serine protease [Salinisphaera aquimarina]|uniref:Rhomboid family intramembrane serine protease n=1 Tax=Salinisphaera aquimarina TaxID=2094031 RepID=A0ABV7EMB1_9GAMM